MEKLENKKGRCRRRTGQSFPLLVGGAGATSFVLNAQHQQLNEAAKEQEEEQLASTLPRTTG
jgi:hypothetical protein